MAGLGNVIEGRCTKVSAEAVVEGGNVDSADSVGKCAEDAGRGNNDRLPERAKAGDVYIKMLHVAVATEMLERMHIAKSG